MSGYATKEWVKTSYQQKGNCVTVTLLASGWNGNKQTVSVDGVTTDHVVFVSPDTSASNCAMYTDNTILCTSVGNGGLTFECESVPDSDVLVNVAICSFK